MRCAVRTPRCGVCAVMALSYGRRVPTTKPPRRAGADRRGGPGWLSGGPRPRGLPGRCVVVVADEFGDGGVDGVEMDGCVPVAGEVPVVVSDAGGQRVGVVTDGG
jgi:hypothetical protein